MQELEDDNDDDSDDKVYDYQTRARQRLIDSTKNNVEKNLKEARLAMREVFIVFQPRYFFTCHRQRAQEHHSRN